MKAEAFKAAPPPPPFISVELKLVFETVDEIEAFFAIMNHTTVVIPVEFGVQAHLIREKLCSILHSVNYYPKWNALDKAIKDY